VEGIIRVIDNPAFKDDIWSGSNPNPGSSVAPYKIYNIGNSSPVKLLHFIDAIENALGKKSIKNFLPLQAGDVPATWADVSNLEKELGYKPITKVENGIKSFVSWYKKYYNIE
jgi:UDP-glucuronate 4-epimerase